MPSTNAKYTSSERKIANGIYILVKRRNLLNKEIKELKLLLGGKYGIKN